MNSGSSCFSPWSAGLTDVHRHAWLPISALPLHCSVAPTLSVSAFYSQSVAWKTHWCPLLEMQTLRPTPEPQIPGWCTQSCVFCVEEKQGFNTDDTSTSVHAWETELKVLHTCHCNFSLPRTHTLLRPMPLTLHLAGPTSALRRSRSMSHTENGWG